MGSSMDIVSIGECMVEFHREQENSPKVFIRSYGGDTLNVIIAAARLGSSVAYLTKVGDDLFSKYLLNEWKGENVDISQILQLKNSFTGIYFIQLEKNGERSFQYYRKGSAASKMAPNDFDPSFFCQATVLYSSGITQALSVTNRRTVSKIFMEFKKRESMDKFVVYDPNYRPNLWSNDVTKAREAQEEILPFTDIVMPSFPSDAPLANAQSPENIIYYYKKQGIDRTIVKLGREGCLFTEDGGKTLHRMPALRIPTVIDTTGAGDAFNGGVLAGLIRNYSIHDAIELGIIVSGLKVQRKGAISSLPMLKEVNKFWKKVQ